MTSDKFRNYSKAKPKFSNTVTATANKPTLIAALALKVSKKEGCFRF